MAKTRLIFTSIFITLFALSINAQIRNALVWEVVKYDITATLPQNYSSDRDLDVKATLNLKNIKNRSYSKLTMRISDKAKVSSVQVNGDTTDFSGGEEKIGGNQKLQRVVVRIPSVSAGGNVSVTVNYKLNVKANSGLNSLSPVGSQFLPLSHWYPTPTSWYFTGGGDFAPTNIKVNSSGGMMILSSGSKTTNGFDLKLNGQPFFTTGNWDVTNANGVEVYVPKGMDANPTISNDLTSLASEAKSFADGMLGKSFDTPIRIVGVSRGAGFSESGIVFVDESLFRRQKLDSQTAMRVAEGVIKTWLGNFVKVEGESYGVIREGLTRYIATEFIEKKYGKDIAKLERLRQRTKYSAISLRDAPLNVVSPVDGYYYTATANKGAMMWKFLSNVYGDDLFKVIKDNTADRVLTLRELQSAFSGQKEYLDYVITKVTQMNLMIGLPQQTGNQAKAALRNQSELDVTVDVLATTASGKNLTSKTTIKANSFGQAIFNTSEKLVRVEVDANKLYPQTNYADDVAPREVRENNALVFIKKEFDRQKFEVAEKNAKAVLKVYPSFDDARILLARSQLALNKMNDAQKNFQAVLALKLPNAQSLSWANVGLGNYAQKKGQKSIALQHFIDAIKTDSELGASLTARRNRNNLGVASNADSEIKAFFTQFDKAVVSNNKRDIEGMMVKGEVARFSGNIAGQAQEWSTEILYVDRIDAKNILVETNMSVRLLNRNNETGLAVYRLSKVGSSWKLSDVEIFEVG